MPSLDYQRNPKPPTSRRWIIVALAVIAGLVVCLTAATTVFEDIRVENVFYHWAFPPLLVPADCPYGASDSGEVLQVHPIATDAATWL